MSGIKRSCPEHESDNSKHSIANRRRKLVSTSESLDFAYTSRLNFSVPSSSSEGQFDCDSDDQFSGFVACSTSPSTSLKELNDAVEPKVDLATFDSGPTPALTGSISESSHDNTETCFGMLADGYFSCWKKSTASKLLKSIYKQRILLKLRLRFDGVTLLNPESEEIGMLNTKVAKGLVSLMGVTTSLRFEAYMIEPNGKDRNTKEKIGTPIEILIYGQSQSSEIVGSVLSKSGLFLQEPWGYSLSTPYRNPHVISWDSDEDSAYLLKSELQKDLDLNKEITAILDDVCIAQFSCQVDQDCRIKTTLKPHQLKALQFMVAREEGLRSDSPLSLWKCQDQYGRITFKHQITHLSQITTPDECRGGILADEMGMGKSLSMLALILHGLSSTGTSVAGDDDLQKENRDNPSRATLLIAPLSTLPSWESQIKKHIVSDGLRIYIYHRPERKISPEELSKYDIVLTTYGTAISKSGSDTLSRILWLRIVLDEAHQIRNRSTRYFQIINALRAERRWCLTGTPVQNKLGDLFSLTQFLRFYPLDTPANSRKYIYEPLSKNDLQGRDNLRLALQAITLRRKQGLCTDRQRFENVEIVNLNDEERQHYISVRAEAKRQLALKTGRLQGQALLRSITTCRQLCSHGYVSTYGASRDTDLTKFDCCDKCGGLISAHKDKKILYQSMCGHQFCHTCSLTRSRAKLQDAEDLQPECLICQEPILANTEGLDLPDSHVKSYDTSMDWEFTSAPSPIKFSSKINVVVGKLKALEHASSVENLDPIKSLVFSNWIQTLNGLGESLSNEGMRYVRIDGSLTRDERRKAVQEFRTSANIRIMLLSYGSGAVGLNLEVATHVHLVDPHWNPMIEAQATARVDRLDQTKDIVISRYIVKNSIEENMQKRQRRKLYDAELSSSYMGAGEDPNVDNNELANLLCEDS